VVNSNPPMNKLVVILCGWSFLPLPLPAAGTAQARMYCLSVRFHQGTDQIGSTLDLSTIASPLNGELAPTFLDTPSYYSGFALDSVFFDGPIEGTLALDAPLAVDANRNGYSDFFEVRQAISTTTTAGSYEVPGVDAGNIAAKWSRAAGSKDGTCILTFTSTMGFGKLGDFNHQFELIEYAGPLAYTLATNRVSGTLNLTQRGDPSSRLTGALLFLKSATNRFNDLELQPGTLTNAAGLILSYTNDFFQRNFGAPTNYFGFVDFDDGDVINTPDQPDYFTWFLSIDDPNDANGNGIPDFSDDVSSTNARTPSLTLMRAGTNLSIAISGSVGHTHEVQQATSLDQTNWATISSVMLSSDPQTVPLPLPTSATTFWRVRAL
jgi:hypothetical protein